MDHKQRRRDLAERGRVEAKRQHQIDLEDQRKRAEYHKKRDIEQKKEWEVIAEEVASKRKKGKSN